MTSQHLGINAAETASKPRLCAGITTAADGADASALGDDLPPSLIEEKCLLCEREWVDGITTAADGVDASALGDDLSTSLMEDGCEVCERGCVDIIPLPRQVSMPRHCRMIYRHR